MRPDTIAVHAGRNDFGELGVHAPPLDLSSTYPLPDLGAAVEAFDRLSAGGTPADGSAVYARLHNPTVRRL
jgi:methionine-gamma-lyase